MSLSLPVAPQIYELKFECAAHLDIRVFLLAGEVGNPMAGNKYLKLGPWLRVAADRHKGMIGVGGAWSNFILSLALATNDKGISSVGIIRGAEHEPARESADRHKQATAMLRDASMAGMKLHFVSRADYRQRGKPAWQQQWQAAYPGYLFVPEGGSSVQAADACQALVPDNFKATHWVVAAGTGATAAGISQAIPASAKLLVVNISGDPQIPQRVRSLRLRLQAQAGQSVSELIFPASTQPRFGRLTAELCELANDCFAQTGVLLDPVYTVKAIQQVQWMLLHGEFAAGARIAVIHTGGLQGWRGYMDDYSKYLSQEVRESINSLYPVT